MMRLKLTSKGHSASPAPNFVPVRRLMAQQRRRRLRIWQRVLATQFAALLAIGATVSLPALARPGPRTHAGPSSVDGRIATLEAERASLDSRARSVTSRLEAARAIGEHPDWSLMLESVARSRANAVVLQQFELRSQRVEVAQSEKDKEVKASPKSRLVYELELSGHAVSPRAVFHFARALESLNVFDEVIVEDSRTAALGAMSTVHFRLKAISAEAPESHR